MDVAWTPGIHRRLTSQELALHVAFLNPQGNFDPSDRGWTHHPDFGGQLVYVKETALALGQLGYRVDIITRRMNDPSWPEFAPETDSYPGHPAVRILRIPCGPPHFLPKEELWPHLASWVGNIIRFYRRERNYPEALTGHYADGGLSAALLSEKVGIPFTFTGHSLGAQKLDHYCTVVGDFDEAVRRFHFDKRIAAERVALSRADRIITSTMQERFEQYGHRLYEGAADVTDDTRFDLIPPGVNVSIFGTDGGTSLDAAVETEIERSLDRDIPIARRRLPLVICSSRLDRKKNHIALVRAWVLSADLRSKANLALVLPTGISPRSPSEQGSAGSRSIVQEIAAEITRHNLWDCIVTLRAESQHELASVYRCLARRYDGVFALTALHEPFGLAPLEAMAAGLPVVVTKFGGPSETLRDSQEEYGALVDPLDPMDIAGALLTLVADSSRWRTMQTRGREMVLRRYTWERTAQGYGNTISSILKGPIRKAKPYRIPDYFANPTCDDIDAVWLRSLYSEEHR